MTLGRRLAAGLLSLVLVALSWVANPTKAYACSCARPTDGAELVESATVIFSGTLVDNQVSRQRRTLTFAVDRVYKGTATTAQQVRTHASGASCGLEITGPGPHVVFARADSDGTATADLCGGTRTGPVPAMLGPGQPPAPEPPRARFAAPGAVPIGLGVVLVGLGVVVVGLAAVLVTRRRRSAGPKR